MMTKPIVLLMTALVASAAWAMDARRESGSAAPHGGVAAAATIPDSARLEKELQQLSWEQFKQVVVAVPKLKNSVDAFGPFGWDYVRANYRTYPWKKSIDRLDETQKVQLAALIEKARNGAGAAGGPGS